MKRLFGILALGLLATPVLAQTSKTCEDQLQEALIRVQVVERDASNARQAEAENIARLLNQGRAKDAQLKAMAEAQAKKDAPKADVPASQEGK
jgi:competence protein ComGC